MALMELLKTRDTARNSLSPLLFLLSTPTPPPFSVHSRVACSDREWHELRKRGGYAEENMRKTERGKGRKARTGHDCRSMEREERVK